MTSCDNCAASRNRYHFRRPQARLGPDREPSPTRSTLEQAGHGHKTCYLLLKGGRCEPGTARGPVPAYGCAQRPQPRYFPLASAMNCKKDASERPS